jgi:pyruvate kinase
LKIPISTLSAPSLLTGNLKNDDEKFILQPGQTVNLTNNRDYLNSSDANLIFVNYPKLTDLRQHQIIFIGDKIKLMVEDVNQTEVFICCRILKGGCLDKHPMEVLISGVKLNLPPIDRDFIEILDIAKQNKVDMIFASINDQFAFETIKCHLKSTESQEQNISLVAKIESQADYDNLESFLVHADGIFIARYKLSRNLSTTEKAIAVEKCIIAKCLKAGIPSILSSNILRRMNELGANEPSSAEISDIFNATIDGSDCIVLANDNVRCIQQMQDTILESEQMINHSRWFQDLLAQVPVPCDISNSVAISACISALASDASAIIVYTENGDIARLIAKFRPEASIVVVTPNESVARKCLILRGVSSIYLKSMTNDHLRNVELAIESGFQFIQQNRIISKYPSCVIAVYAQKEGLHNTNTMRVIEIPSKADRISQMSIGISSHGLETA